MGQNRFIKKYIPAALLLVILSLAVIVLVKKPKLVVQAIDPVFPVIEFQGEYKIGEGEWLPVTDKTHISSTKGQVRLKGFFQMRDPESLELLGPVYPETLLAVYLDHIAMSIAINDQIIHESDVENPAYGSVVCGQIWEYFTIPETEQPLVITLTNHHKYGNENAVDNFLDNCFIYAGGVFERQHGEDGEWQRVLGIAIVLSSMIILGTALFAFKLHIKKSSEMALVGFIILFAGLYYIFSSENICLWNNNYRWNTSILCLCKELYMLFVTVFLLKGLSSKTVKVGNIFVGISLCCISVLFGASIVGICLPYDAWLIWGMVEFAICFGLLICLFFEQDNLNKDNALVYSVNIFILLSYLIDFIAVYFGWWENTRLSMMFFIVMFIGASILILKIVPQHMEARERAIKLEAEQKLLEAKLHESRIAVMISQIQPHFLYNSLAVIQELCYEEPKKAEKAIGTLADFLKENMISSMSDKVISFREELNHTKKYLEIEHLRFEEQLSVVYDIQTDQFCIPSLTLQPIVENAVRHGVRKKEEGGTITISSREQEQYFEVLVEDNGLGFDKNELEIQEGTHIGIKNVRDRLERMCHGQLEIHSEQGKGTCAVIRIKKEDTVC